MKNLVFLIITILALVCFINGLSYVNTIKEKKIDRQQQVIESLSYYKINTVCPKCQAQLKVIDINEINNYYMLVTVKCINCNSIFYIKLYISDVRTAERGYMPTRAMTCQTLISRDL